jgi:hypothetical protein
LLLGGDDRDATSGSATRASRFLTGLLSQAAASGGPVTDPGWRTKPSWDILTTEDRMIPRQPSAMSHPTGSTVVEVAASHSVVVSQPAAVADLIKQAVSAVTAQQ